MGLVLARARGGIIPARAGFTQQMRRRVSSVAGSSPLARGLPERPSGRLSRGPDHPRSRGVYGMVGATMNGAEGSSPLARGLPQTAYNIAGNNRIIPARAGFTGYWGRRSVRSRDHPRSRGVYSLRISPNMTPIGSSPLARGLPGAGGVGEAHGGIIPARAGFTKRCPPAIRRNWDHPRSRGVYILRAVSARWPNGSSPLARGLRVDKKPAEATPGIIPARAGFTRTRRGRAHSPRDHPRSRGVYQSSSEATIFVAGSSPLARGLLRAGRVFSQPEGIIPARAGFTRCASNARQQSSDHPRSRGVYIMTAVQIVVAWGSSPLARGLPWLDPYYGGQSGDHPRSRGVYYPFSSAHLVGRGSSPLARGLQFRGEDARDERRIIPARAGFTGRRRPRPCARADHPRSRGVYPLGPIAPSGPRRIIPARAGFTPRRDGAPGWCEDHPRSRGVYTIRTAQKNYDRGSSPLARGLRRCRDVC